jgi:hypothetical protein
MRCRAEHHAKHRSLAAAVEACDICVAVNTLPADETPSGDIETEIVLQSDRVPAEVCTAVGRAGLAIGNAGRKGLDHIVVVVR